MSASVSCASVISDSVTIMTESGTSVSIASEMTEELSVVTIASP